MSQSEQFVQMYLHVGNILLIKNRFNHLCFQYILFVVSYVLVEKKLFFILLCTSRENGIRLNSFWTIGRVVFNEIGSFDMDNVIMSYISKINNQIGTKFLNSIRGWLYILCFKCRLIIIWATQSSHIFEMEIINVSSIYPKSVWVIEVKFYVRIVCSIFMGFE